MFAERVRASPNGFGPLTNCLFWHQMVISKTGNGQRDFIWMPESMVPKWSFLLGRDGEREDESLIFILGTAPPPRSPWRELSETAGSGTCGIY